MWKNYSKSYLKNNRAACVSIRAAVLIATAFLSLLCSLAYNFWAYEIEQIILKEGDWQGRVAGELSGDDLALIQNFANIKKVVFNEELSGQKGAVADIYFENARTIYQDLPLIGAQLGLKKDALQYHELLLSRYFIHNPADESPPMLLALYLFILTLAAISLILIIRNSFELSMHARIRQFGIFASIGATPKQIRVCLLQEAAALSFAPMLLGSLAGILASRGLLGAVNLFAADVAGRRDAIFHYHPAVWAITIATALLTVLLSAWKPARKLSRMTPLAAIRNPGGLQLTKRKHSRLLRRLFGMKGELAGNALRAQKKSFRTASVSMLLSFLGFSFMLTFTELSAISTRFTYFERYQDAWDIMISLKNTKIADFDLTKEMQDISGVQNAVVYQKANALTLLPEDLQSPALASLGGLETVGGIPKTDERFLVSAPLVILDDASFLSFCSQIGAPSDLSGAVALNRIWDSVNTNFRYKKYIPFVKEGSRSTALYNAGQNRPAAKIPVLAYTQEVPRLREEYPDNALVYFLPAALWEKISGRIDDAEPDSYIRILSGLKDDRTDLSGLEKEIASRLFGKYEIESENRIQERLSNERLIDGMKMIFGGFCALLALIGIANVFSNTLGFLRQRKREFAQYMSIGLTPREMGQIFAIEALAVAGKPLLITLPLTAVFAQWMIRASHLDPADFWPEAPIAPILLFAAAIVFFVALAYYIGAKRLLQCELSEILRKDAFV